MRHCWLIKGRTFLEQLYKESTMLKPKLTILLASAVSVAAVLLYASAAAAESKHHDYGTEQSLPSESTVAEHGDELQPSDDRDVIEIQEPEQFRLSDLVGTTVIVKDGRAIGEVADLLLTPAGLPEALLVSVGGIMGIGGKEVAIPWTRVAAFANEHDFQLLAIDVRRETLETAPSFQAKPVRDFVGPALNVQEAPDVAPARGSALSPGTSE
jgi:sporulation protein YlmC with PRC-barrel domain